MLTDNDHFIAEVKYHFGIGIDQSFTAMLNRHDIDIIAAAAEGVELYEVTEPVMKKIADTETPQALTAVVAKQSAALEELAAAGGIVLVLDRIGDPGNLGTMIRTADAAGISGVVLLAGCTDIFAPKAVRSTMGSLLHIPVAEGICEADFISWARKNGYEITVTCLENADSLYPVSGDI